MIRYSRHGKMHFLRIGRLAITFCIANPRGGRARVLNRQRRVIERVING